MKYSALIQCIFIILLISGCTSIQSKNLIAVVENEKAVVFSPCHVKPSFISCDATWRNEQTQTEVIFGIKNQAQVLEPGTYSLIGFISDKKGDTKFCSITNLHNIASFSVKGGEVLYIGDLEFDIRKGLIHNAIAIFNDKNDFQQYLLNHKPELLPKLQTRLIQLSPEVIAKRSML